METDIGQLKDISREQFRFLYSLSQELNSSEFRESFLEQTLDVIIKVINAERGIVVKYDEQTNEFSIVAARNINKETVKDVTSFSSGIIGEVIKTGEPCLFHDALSDPNLSQFESVQIYKIKSVLGVPITSNGKVWGVILADSLEDRRNFTEDNLVFLDFLSNLISLSLDKIMHLEHLRDENLILRQKVESLQSIPNMIGNSPVMRTLAATIHKVAKTDVTVLLTGESGTGKDLAAQAIHELSQRNNNPFLAQFCGNIPDTLLESELFGYKKGAFSGANADKKGLFEVANGGTFFLDEIGDISLALQAKLLRVLQNKEIIRLGDTQVRHVNVRILTATNKDIRQLTREGKFREDLFYRLNVFPIVIPPLRQRKGDVLLLANYFIKKYSGRNDVKLDPGTVRKLEEYAWPGNVRQLENVIQRALIVCDEKRILPQHIMIEGLESITDFKGTLDEYELLLLKKRLEELDGNRTLAAKSLGVSLRWVQGKLKEIAENQHRDE
ncbi:MAG: sigma 54-interacting transcriptional regulator [Bacteroidota bacterium]|nr:sigma 54-interacting transcriptional regulator [Bacteroidota bacterium]